MKRNGEWLRGAALARAAARFSREPIFLGHLLRATGKSDAELCAALRCDLEALHGACLCFRPRPDRHAEDVAIIARAVGIDPERLARVIAELVRAEE